MDGASVSDRLELGQLTDGTMSDLKPLHIPHQPPSGVAAGEVPPSAAAVSWPAAAEGLREYAAVRGRSAPERCDLCGAVIATEHRHLVNVPTRSLLCVCKACYLPFAPDRAGAARFRAVPQRYRLVPEFAAAREGWEALRSPLGLTFFFRNSATGRTTTFSPGEAGATEFELPFATWDEMVRSVPALAALKDDVEALLVRTTSPAPHGGFGAATATVDAVIAPIDACYELLGRIRRAWRGFTGGDQVWLDVDEFFARATERARRQDADGWEAAVLPAR